MRYNSLRDIRHATLMPKLCYVPSGIVTNRLLPGVEQVAPFLLVNAMFGPVLGLGRGDIFSQKKTVQRYHMMAILII